MTQDISQLGLRKGVRTLVNNSLKKHNCLNNKDLYKNLENDQADQLMSTVLQRSTWLAKFYTWPQGMRS